jgi:hypothetical protein
VRPAVAHCLGHSDFHMGIEWCRRGVALLLLVLMLLVVVMFFTVAVPVRMHDLVEDGAEAVFFVLLYNLICKPNCAMGARNTHLGHRRGIGLRSRRRRSNIGGHGCLCSRPTKGQFNIYGPLE